jgi:hypothetical protein
VGPNAGQAAKQQRDDEMTMPHEPTTDAGFGTRMRTLPEWESDEQDRPRHPGSDPERHALLWVIGVLSSDDIALVAMAWRKTDTAAFRAGLRAVFAAYKQDLFVADYMLNYAYEPVIRAMEALEAVLNRADELGLPLPAIDIVRCFARHFGSDTEPRDAWLPALEAGPDAWKAALYAVAAITVADVVARSRPPALWACLDTMLRLRTTR